MAVAGLWYALQTRPNEEDATAKRLDRLEFVETYSPQAHIEVQRRGRVISEVVPAFPTYLLCRMPADADAWRAASDIDGVSRLLGKDANGIPTPLRRGEIEAITFRELLGELEPPRPKTLKNGCTVRIRFGHFVGAIGTLLMRRRERARVRTSLLGREIELDLPSHALELIEKLDYQEPKKRNRRKLRSRSSVTSS